MEFDIFYWKGALFYIPKKKDDEDDEDDEWGVRVSGTKT